MRRRGNDAPVCGFGYRLSLRIFHTRFLKAPGNGQRIVKSIVH